MLTVDNIDMDYKTERCLICGTSITIHSWLMAHGWWTKVKSYQNMTKKMWCFSKHNTVHLNFHWKRWKKIIICYSSANAILVQLEKERRKRNQNQNVYSLPKLYMVDGLWQRNEACTLLVYNESRSRFIALKKEKNI